MQEQLRRKKESNLKRKRENFEDCSENQHLALLPPCHGSSIDSIDNDTSSASRPAQKEKSDDIFFKIPFRPRPPMHTFKSPLKTVSDPTLLAPQSSSTRKSTQSASKGSPIRAPHKTSAKLRIDPHRKP